MMADKGEVWRRLVDKHGLQVGGTQHLRGQGLTMAQCAACFMAFHGATCSRPASSAWQARHAGTLPVVDCHAKGPACTCR